MIEINRAGSEYIFRINPHNSRLIDRRKNVHRGRWERFAAYRTEEEARTEILKLEKAAKVQK